MPTEFSAYRTLLENLPAAAGLFFEKEQTPAFYNAAYQDMMKNRPFSQKALQAAEDGVRQAFGSLKESGQPVKLEYCIGSEPEHPLWLRVCLSRLVLDGQSCVTACYTDFTRERVLAEQLDLIANSTNSGICVFRQDEGKSQLFYANDQYFALMGVTQNEYRLRQSEIETAALTPADRSRMEDLIWQAQLTGHTGELEHGLLCPNGSERWVQSKFVVRSGATGERYFILVATDLTVQKENGTKIDSLINAIPGGVAVYRIGKSIETVYSSDGVPKLSGRTMEEYLAWVQGSLLDNTVFEDDLVRVKDVIDRAVAQQKDLSVLYRIKHKNGTPTWVQLSATKIGEEDGELIYYAVYTKPTQETELYRQVVEDSTTAVFIGDKKSRRLLYANPAWRRLEGVSEKEQISGRKLFELIPEERRIFSARLLDNLPTTGFYERYLEHAGGKYLHIYARLMNWNGVEAYILYAADETREHAGRMELQQLIDRVPGGVGIYDLSDGKMERMYLNDGYFQMLGFENAQECPQRKELFAGIHPEDAAQLQEIPSKQLAENERIDLTYRVRKAKTGYTYLRMQGTVSLEPGGRRLLYCSFFNVDAEKKAEQQYQKQVDDIDRFDADNLLVKARYNLNRNLAEYSASKVKARAAELETETYDEALHAAAQPVMTEQLRQRLLFLFDRHRLIHECAMGNTEVTLEYPRRLETGRICWIELNCKTFQEPHTGEVFCFLYNYDVTSRVMEQKIMNRLTGTQYELLVTLDLTTHEVVVNRTKDDKRVAEIFTSEEFCRDYQQRLERVIVEEERRMLLHLLDEETLREQLSRHETCSATFSVMEEAGPRRKRLWYCYLDELKETVLATCSDVTELYNKEQAQIDNLRRATHKAQQADAAKTDFLARVSHDMRTPLNGILGLTRLMREKSDWESIQTDVAQLEMSGQYLLNLINDTLDVSKIERGQLELHPTVCDGRTVFQSTLDLLKPNLKEKNIHFYVHAEDLPFATLFLDVGRAEQLIMNIVGNAIKFTPQGGRIDFLMENISCENNILTDRIIVRDNGIGISADFLPHLFEPFTQEHGGATSQYTTGSGLGMTISKQIVELMGGSIHVKSSPGEGTEFDILLKLPIATEQQIAEQQEAMQKPLDLNRLAGKRVLLCEDHPLNAQIATRLLNRQNILVDRAENGAKGVQMFENSLAGTYAAVLMDIRMPVMDGLEAARRIRQLPRKDAAAVPILAMTANAFDADVEASLAAGMNAHLAKPIEPQKLYETLCRLL